MDRPGLIGAEWRKSTRSGEENTSCVEVAITWLRVDRSA
ncbi:DUF397 domain-containing protein [Actinoallomurus sp. NPDC052308]